MQSTIGFNACSPVYRGDVATPLTRGKTIRQLRTKRGLSQSALARAIGVETQGTISDWENDKSDISAPNLLALIEFFGVDPDVLGYEMPSTAGAGSTVIPPWAVGTIGAPGDEFDPQRPLDEQSLHAKVNYLINLMEHR